MRTHLRLGLFWVFQLVHTELPAIHQLQFKVFLLILVPAVGFCFSKNSLYLSVLSLQFPDQQFVL